MKWKNGLFNLTIALNCLLIFWALFENKITVPAWMQVIGRSHPLVLHFPIALLVLYIAWSLLSYKFPPALSKELSEILLLFTALTAVLTALAGLLLSREEGYNPESIRWHQWAGIALSVLVAILYQFRNTVYSVKWVFGFSILLAFFLLIFTGDKGAKITHGDDFLFAGMMKEKEKPKVVFEQAMIYRDIVQPLLQVKCMSCHNNDKAKGNLVMETEELLLKGGRHGKLFDTLNPAQGLLLERTLLPVDDKKHMPPAGKPQLTDMEMQILQHWIKAGAPFSGFVKDLPEEDTFRILSAKLLGPAEGDVDYGFAKADEKKIRSLNNNNRVISPIATGSTALSANFYNGPFYNTEALKELLVLKAQIISLDLGHLPVTDEDIPIISQFGELRHLNLDFTQISGKKINELQKLQQLQTLSVSGTKITIADLAAVEKMPKLKKVFVWNTASPPEELEKLKNRKEGPVFETGFRSDTMLLKLNAPIFKNEEQIFAQPITLKLKHYIAGAVMRYTTDGTDPDSLKSPVYDEHVVIDHNTTVKAKAFKPGWLASDVSQMVFFKAGLRPDSVIFSSEPELNFRGEGARSLADQLKGDFNLTSGRWVGYYKNKMAATMLFNEPVTVQSINFSTMKIVPSSIMLPLSIEVFGGADSMHLKLLGRVVPKQPEKMEHNGELVAIPVKFSATRVRCLKVIAMPYSKLPKWHPNKKYKGSLYVDEILIN